MNLWQLPMKVKIIDSKSINAIDQLLATLKTIHCNTEYNDHTRETYQFRKEKYREDRHGNTVHFCIGRSLVMIYFTNSPTITTKCFV